MTEINGLNERISKLKILYQEAERLNLKDKAIELLIDINYVEELRELRRKQEHIEQKWIPVSKRLPKDGQLVIVSYPYDASDLSRKRVLTAWYNTNYGFTCGIIDAWMPLPKPYKQEIEDKE